MIDLMGEHRHKVDAKGRLSLPAAFRKVLSEDLVVTVDPRGKCLYVFEPEGFNEWVASFFETDGGFNPRNEVHVDIRSALKGGAHDVSIDSAGRINVPALLRGKVGIEKDVVLVGNTGYFEIWDAKRREQQDASIDLAALLYGSSQA